MRITHSMRITEGQSRPKLPTAQRAHQTTTWPRGSPSAAHGSIHCPGHDVRSKRTAAARLDHQRRLARRLSTRSPPGSPRPLQRPPATPASWWFSAFERGLRVDLAHSAPSRSISSPIVMVASTPGRQDHLELIQSTCAPPAMGCRGLHGAARQWGERKRSIVQRRSALSTAL